MDAVNPMRNVRIKLMTAAITLACASAAVQSPPAASKFRTGESSIAVTNCGDSGPGSLRAALGSAGDGDTIDLTQLACSAITLTTGALIATQGSITLTGPGSAELTISGSNSSSVLRHTSPGTLTLSGMTLADGFNSEPTYVTGGCLSSEGSASLYDVVVSNCHAYAPSTQQPWILAQGGGIFTAGDLTLVRSKVSGSTVSTATLSPGVAHYMYVQGGGIRTMGILTLLESSISDNAAIPPLHGTSYCEGGGIFLDTTGISTAPSTIQSSTISGNSAMSGGGMLVSTGAPLTIINSTISGNHATDASGGGVQIFSAPEVEIRNSTIAFNTASDDPSDPSPSGAGLQNFNHSLRLESTIIARNFAGLIPDDLSHDPSTPVLGSHNLIAASRFATPPDTITDDPGLLPLTDNGGPTATHAFDNTSPAFGRGSNDSELDHDQRGAGYPRVSGGAADIGAYEYQLPDFIFGDGFELPLHRGKT